jgi:hypothetical protein
MLSSIQHLRTTYIQRTSGPLCITNRAQNLQPGNPGSQQLLSDLSTDVLTPPYIPGTVDKATAEPAAGSSQR